MYMNKRPNHEVNDQSNFAYVYEFEYVYWTGPAGHIVNLPIQYPLKHDRKIEKNSSKHRLNIKDPIMNYMPVVDGRAADEACRQSKEFRG